MASLDVSIADHAGGTEGRLLHLRHRFVAALYRQDRVAIHHVLSRVGGAAVGVLTVLILYLGLIIVFPELAPVVHSQCFGQIPA